jgi:putative ABC transport system substrate-binding protein
MNQPVRHRLISIACALLLVLSLPSPGLGHVLIVQSSAIDAYQQAVAGFNQHFATTSMPGIAAIQPAETMVLDPADPESGTLVVRKVQELQPGLILAVGTKALEAVQGLATPTIYLLVPNPDPLVGKRRDVSGVRMMTGPEQQLTTIKATFPAVTRVGLLHNPQRSPDLGDLARETAKGLHLKIIELTAGDDRQALSAMNGMQGDHLDALIVAPEPSFITPILMEGLTIFSLEQQVPLIAFAPKYLEQGAAMVIFTTPEQTGRQAAEMAKRTLTGPTRLLPRPEYGQEATVLTNDRVIEQLAVPTTRTRIIPEGQTP